MTLPGSPWLARDGGELLLDGHSLRALAQRHGTPLFVYSQRAMQAAAAAYQRALAPQPHLLCYAMKANPSLAVLQTFRTHGLRLRHRLRRRTATCDGGRGRSGQGGLLRRGQDRREMELALRAGVACFNVESEGELERLSAVAHAQRAHRAREPARQPRRRRRHAPVHLDRPEEQQVRRGARRGRGDLPPRGRAAGLQVVGIDCHIGSQITQIEPYLDALDRLLDLVEAVEAAGIPLHHVDLGGGLGITYTDETAARGGRADRAGARAHEGAGPRPPDTADGARPLAGGQCRGAADAGVYLKPGETKNFCIVDAAMNDLMRPALYEAYMQIEALRPLGAGPGGNLGRGGPGVRIGRLARPRPSVLRVAPDDVLAILSAGAYGMAMASNYNSRARAAEVMITVDGEARVIRAREDTAQLFGLEQLLP
jgi:diaminopimelate decarboxylase